MAKTARLPQVLGAISVLTLLCGTSAPAQLVRGTTSVRCFALERGGVLTLVDEGYGEISEPCKELLPLRTDDAAGRHGKSPERYLSGAAPYVAFPALVPLTENDTRMPFIPVRWGDEGWRRWVISVFTSDTCQTKAEIPLFPLPGVVPSDTTGVSTMDGKLVFVGYAYADVTLVYDPENTGAGPLLTIPRYMDSFEYGECALGPRELEKFPTALGGGYYLALLGEAWEVLHLAGGGLREVATFSQAEAALSVEVLDKASISLFADDHGFVILVPARPGCEASPTGGSAFLEAVHYGGRGVRRATFVLPPGARAVRVETFSPNEFLCSFELEGRRVTKNVPLKHRIGSDGVARAEGSPLPDFWIDGEGVAHELRGKMTVNMNLSIPQEQTTLTFVPYQRFVYLWRSPGGRFLTLSGALLPRGSKSIPPDSVLSNSALLVYDLLERRPAKVIRLKAGTGWSDVVSLFSDDDQLFAFGYGTTQAGMWMWATSEWESGPQLVLPDVSVPPLPKVGRRYVVSTGSADAVRRYLVFLDGEILQLEAGSVGIRLDWRIQWGRLVDSGHGWLADPELLATAGDLVAIGWHERESDAPDLKQRLSWVVRLIGAHGEVVSDPIRLPASAHNFSLSRKTPGKALLRYELATGGPQVSNIPLQGLRSG